MKKVFTMIQSVVHLLWQKNALMPLEYEKTFVRFPNMYWKWGKNCSKTFVIYTVQSKMESISLSWLLSNLNQNPHTSPRMARISEIIIFGLKMRVKSGLEKIFLKSVHAGDYFLLLHKSAQNHKFSNENNYLPAWRDFKLNFSRPLFTIIFRPKIVILDPDFNSRVKTMYESVK